MQDSIVAGRLVPRAWHRMRRPAQVELFWDSLEQCGATLLGRSSTKTVPVFTSVMTPEQERFGVWLYPSTLNQRVTRNRPKDEFRLQLRYGGKPGWTGNTSLQRDPFLAETTLLLGIGAEDGLFVGLDPERFDPLPLGDSVFFKAADVAAGLDSGWHVSHRRNAGRKRQDRGEDAPLETLVFFTPPRLLDYVRFEREVEPLGLDAPTRARIAEAAGARRLRSAHEEFGLSPGRLLEVVRKNKRLGVALRGSVAEEHLEILLTADPGVAQVRQIDEDARHDFDVRLADGRDYRVEVKNVSPRRPASAVAEIDLQKTRGKVPERLYTRDQFDVVAACMWPLTGVWEYRYQLTSRLRLHPKHGADGRMASSQTVDESWAVRLADLEPPP